MVFIKMVMICYLSTNLSLKHEGMMKIPARYLFSHYNYNKH